MAPSPSKVASDMEAQANNLSTKLYWHAVRKAVPRVAKTKRQKAVWPAKWDELATIDQEPAQTQDAGRSVLGRFGGAANRFSG